ncbi:MAG: AAA-like domain-containing protein [Cyanobacteria bacterium P01_G01_bin.39]
MGVFQVGGSLQINDSTYIIRQADRQLYEALLRGEFCYVFNCRQMGKSSLRVRVKNRLEQQGYTCVSLDMTNIGSKDISPPQWYKSVAAELWRGLNLIGKVKFKQWWQEQDGLSPVQQLNNFIDEIVLSRVVAEKIVIFIDEVDSVLSLNFSNDDFFALIRYFYNARSDQPAYNRLSFALFGVATPNDLIRDRTKTPFNIGTSIELGGFCLKEAAPLIAGLQDNFSDSKSILQEILVWTGGQPFLTQKLCKIALEYSLDDSPILGTEAIWVENLVRTKIIDNWEAQDEPEHLRTIRDRLLANETTANRLLNIVKRILTTGAIPIDNSPEQAYLLLTNLVIKQNGSLVPRNPIYQEIFNLEWVKRQQANLRPFSKEIELWLASDCQDQSRLLRGQALLDAEQWASLHDISQKEFQFLAASQQQEMQQALETTKLQEVESRLKIEKQNSRLQKSLVLILGGALALTTGLGIYAQQQSLQAKKSEQKSLTKTIESLIALSEAYFFSDRHLDSLVRGLQAATEFDKLEQPDRDLKAQIERNLRRSNYNIAEKNRLIGHKGPVWELKFNSDNSLIVSASEDQTAKLWRADGTLIATLIGHTAGVWGVDFNQDSDRIVTASWDKTVKIWDTYGRLLKTLWGHEDFVWEVKYTPGDRAIASASWDNTVKLWTPQGELITSLEGHQDRVWGIAFSSDGRLIATASWDKTIKIWDLEETLANKQPLLLSTLAGHQDSVNDVDFSPDNQTLVSSSNDRTLKLWDLSNPARPIIKRTLQGHRDRVIKVKYNRQKSQIVSTSDDRTVKIWSNAGKLISTLPEHSDRVIALDISSDGQTIASGGFEKIIHLWQPDNELIHHLEGHEDSIWHVAFSPNGKLVASASRDTKVKLWTNSGAFLRTFDGHRNRVNDVTFHPDNQLIASGSDDLTIKLWNLDGKAIKTLKGHTSAVFAVAFSPDGKYLASATDNNEIKIWNLQGELIKTFRGHQGAIIELAWSPDGKILATTSRDKTAKLWQWKTKNRAVTTLTGHKDVVFSVKPSPNGKIWATASWDGTVKLWSLAGEELNVIGTGERPVNEIDFTSDGQTIATAMADGAIEFWNLAGEKTLTLEAHRSNVRTLDISSNGQTLVSAGEDYQIILWNLNKIANFNHSEYACNWLKDYLKTNRQISASDRQLCL